MLSKEEIRNSTGTHRPAIMQRNPMTRPGTLMRLLIPLVRALFRLLYRVEVKGEFRPGERTLIIANHQSFLDPFLFGCFLPVWPAYLVYTTIAAKWYSRIFLRFVPHALVDTTKPTAM